MAVELVSPVEVEAEAAVDAASWAVESCDWAECSKLQEGGASARPLLAAEAASTM